MTVASQSSRRQTRYEESRTSTVRTQKQERFRERYGPWAVVTGASSGIGREMAFRLAEAGFDLILVARRRELLDDLAADLMQRHVIGTRVIASDLATQRGVEAIEDDSRDLDVGLLVAAAGFGTSGSFLDADIACESEMLEVNCRAALATTLHFGRRFVARGRGGIVLMSSLVGFQGVPLSAHYAATKAYVQSLAEALHVELGPQGVDVLASAPGPVRSGFESRAGMRMRSALQPSDVAMATLDALGRKTTVVPGLLSKVLTYSLAPLSRPVRARVMGRVMYDMTKHQRGMTYAANQTSERVAAEKQT